MQISSAPTLSDLGIYPGATLEASVPLRGGAQCGKMVKGRSKEKPQTDELAAKLRWLQEQAQRRIAARDALQAQRDKAAAEAEMTRKNNLKVMNAMRSLMRDDKLGALKKDLEVLTAMHEAAVERKDALLARLMENHDFAFDQHSACAMAHSEHLERLIRLQDQRLLLIERQFEADLKILVDEFDEEREEVIKGHRDEVKELEMIYAMVEDEEKEEEEAAIGEVQTLKQECREKREDAIDDLRSVLDSRLEVIQDSFENAHLEYLERTDKRVSDFKHYTRVNRERERDIERSVRAIERLQLNMQEIRNNMLLSKRKFEDQRKLLTKEKATIQEQVSELRGTMRKFQGEQRRRRTALATQADRAKKSLEERIALAETILQLGEMARKKETEREKVRPFVIPKEESERMEAEIAEAGEVDPASSVSEEKHPLHFFHRKFNKALAEKLVAENERDRLRRENDQLMNLLKQVQDGLVVNDDVLGRANSLFVVNGRSNVARDPLPVARAQPATNTAAHADFMMSQSQASAMPLEAAAGHR